MRPEPKSRDPRRRVGLSALVVVVVALAACPGPRRTEQPPSAEAPAAQPAAPAAADSSVTLEGTEWSLVALGGQPVAASEGRTRPGFRLVADGRKIQGSAGCNRMMGTYELDGASLRFGPIASTKMACPALETETNFLSALGATTRYEIAGSNLTLFGGDAPLARLEAAGAAGP